jgi:hypothetical protein
VAVAAVAVVRAAVAVAAVVATAVAVAKQTGLTQMRPDE